MTGKKSRIRIFSHIASLIILVLFVASIRAKKEPTEFKNESSQFYDHNDHSNFKGVVVNKAGRIFFLYKNSLYSSSKGKRIDLKNPSEFSKYRKLDPTGSGDLASFDSNTFLMGVTCEEDTCVLILKKKSGGEKIYLLKISDADSQGAGLPQSSLLVTFKSNTTRVRQCEGMAVVGGISASTSEF